jgi:hypothetical protein
MALFLLVGVGETRADVGNNYVSALSHVSSPDGLFTTNFYVTNSIPSLSATAPASTNGYSFIGWTTNGSWTNGGVWVRTPAGAAINPITITIYSPTTITANYLPTSQDSEKQGVPDWWKMLYFGTTNRAATNDAQGDGFDLLTKYQRGYDPTQFVILEDGGISRRDSASLNVLLDLNMIFFAQLSDPPGIFSQQLPVNKNSAQSTIAAPLSTNGYSFTGWWDAAGNRIDSADTAGVGSLTVGGVQTSVTARYLPTSQDTNSNGVPDWWELYYLDNLTNSADSQPTRDGFSIQTKYQRGYDPRLIQRIVDGGISRRGSASVNVDLQIFERYAQALLDGSLTDFFSPDASSPSGVNFGTNAAPVAGDWNGDGLTDLFVLSGNGVRVFQNTGSEVAPDYT